MSPVCGIKKIFRGGGVNGNAKGVFNWLLSVSVKRVGVSRMRDFVSVIHCVTQNLKKIQILKRNVIYTH